jgi:hypothetical protein
VQGYGTADGFTWYFRARHFAWTFDVWDVPFQENGWLPDAPEVFSTGDEHHNASWMPYPEAWAAIEQSIAAFRAREAA